MALQVPLIHLNGTSSGELQNQVDEAYRAIAKAQRTLANMGPNARDYYPLGPDAFAVARQQHEARMKKLIEINAELEEIAEAIWKQTI
jgi:hypothetical protein